MADEEARIEEIKKKWNQSTKSNVLDLLFGGTGYRTVGYYKAESDSLADSVRNMTSRLAEISGMDAGSHVLDLGCGQGIPVLDIAVERGCSVVGVDLSDCHIEVANSALEVYREEKKSDLRAEFYAASYFDLPGAVTSQSFTHVMMQTSMFYAHHRIDEILTSISKLLSPRGILVTTDMLRGTNSKDSELVQKLMKMNSMSALLTLDELKQALARNGFKYTDSEVLDEHCVRSSAAKIDKITQDNISCPVLPLFKLKAELFKDDVMTFQLIVAKKT